jgi:hypothetical protein
VCDAHAHKASGRSKFTRGERRGVSPTC